MAVASPALALGAMTPQPFTFPRRTSVKIQIRFYSDAAATPGSEIAVSAGGSRTLSITTESSVVTLDRTDYFQPSVVSAINNSSQACNAATWYEFNLADGLGQLYVTATAGANPGGAQSYRIWVDIEPNG